MISPPYASRCAALDAGASAGMTMTRGMSSRWPASATAWAWLPEEKVTHAAAPLVGGEPGERVVGAAELEGAGALKIFALEEQLARGRGRSAFARSTTGVRWATPAIWRAASSMSAKVGSGTAGQRRGRRGRGWSAMTWSGRLCYHQDSLSDAGWSSPVARWAHNPKVAGSNPPPATNFSSVFRFSGEPRFALNLTAI